MIVIAIHVHSGREKSCYHGKLSHDLSQPGWQTPPPCMYIVGHALQTLRVVGCYHVVTSTHHVSGWVWWVGGWWVVPLTSAVHQRLLQSWCLCMDSAHCHQSPVLICVDSGTTRASVHPLYNRKRHKWQVIILRQSDVNTLYSSFGLPSVTRLSFLIIAMSPPPPIPTAPFYRQENTATRECRAFIQHGSWNTYREPQ